ncbi:tape measure protein [Chitinophaga sp. Hz27]|uniref:tape measure protein n=1 Tax=Chitinophaga sp. Hz27 TaxID=3347169 RepID=UPI0035DA4578
MNEFVQYTLSLKDLITNQLKSIDSSAKGVEATMGNLQTTIHTVGSAIGLAFGVHEIVHFGKELLNVTAEFEGYNNVIKYASLDAADAEANVKYLNDAVTRLHLPMKEATEQFSELQGGMYGTGIEGQKLRDVFEGISEGSAVMHLTADQFSRTVYALKEVGELGTLQTRQMRMLAMALPGSMKLAAESMHMNTAKFHQAMEEGDIKAGDFLQRFSKRLREHFGSGLANAGDSLIAKMNDTQTAFMKLQIEMGESLRPLYISIMQGLIDLVGNLKSLWEWGMKNKELLSDIARVLIVAAGGWIAYKGIMFGIYALTRLNVFWQGLQYASITLLGDGMLKASSFTKFMAGAQVMLNNAFRANPIGFILTALTALAALLVTLYNRVGWFRGAVWGMVFIFKEFGRIVSDIFKGIGMQIDGLLHFNVDEIRNGAKKAIDAIYDSGKRLATAAREGYQAGIADFNNSKQGAGIAAPVSPAISNPSASIPGLSETESKDKSTKVSGKKVYTINIKIDNLIKDFSIKTTNITESAQKVKELVTQALLSAVNDSQIIAGK